MEHMKNKKNEPENKKAVKEKLKKEQIKEENESFENKEEQKSNKINTFLNKKTDFKVYELILFGTLIMIVSVFLTVVVMNDASHNKNALSNSSLKSDEKLAEFEEVYDLINTSYYKKVSKKKLIEGAINGMLDSLDDPHTSYFTKTEKENFDELMNGSYDGIGAEISLDKDGNVIVFSVFKNSPSQEAGLKFNDKIMEVNGKSTKGMSTTEVVALIKDAKTYDVNGKKIGYVVINTFANNTYSQFRSNVEQLEKENISGLVIDVRNNSGGYLHSVTNMLDMFLPKGTISYQIADRKTTYKYAATTSESRNYPVAVLVNKASASASEILAIGLKESYGADVVGTYTYGKGTVQTTKNLETSKGMIKYTIQKWLSPNGNWINKKGVEPTVIVELSSSYENNPIEANDNQLQKALNVVANK